MLGGPLQVQSEVYSGEAFIGVKTLKNSNALVVLNFDTNLAKNCCTEPEIDEDGDLVVQRRQIEKIELEYSTSTTLPLVGLQLWRGALLLSDFIISQNSHMFKDRVVLELGSGVGLTGIIAGIYCKEVICTDVNQETILNLIRRNIKRNSAIITATMSVEALDFYQEELSCNMLDKLKQTDFVIAADVIYDDDLTDAFIKCLTKILLHPPSKTFLLALEKRYVFTVKDLDCVPPCYDHFLMSLRNTWITLPMSKWKIEEIETDFKQFFQYERTKEMVLLKIST